VDGDHLSYVPPALPAQSSLGPTLDDGEEDDGNLSDPGMTQKRRAELVARERRRERRRVMQRSARETRSVVSESLETIVRCVDCHPAPVLCGPLPSDEIGQNDHLAGVYRGHRGVYRSGDGEVGDRVERRGQPLGSRKQAHQAVCPSRMAEAEVAVRIRDGEEASALIASK
jgi:hypothetical protein